MTTRERIVQTADRLFYERGFEHTSFTDIAAEVELSRGNFYYHFKTKDEILESVIELRKTKTLMMLQSWTDRATDPAGQIRCFIDMMVMNGSKIRRHGCPVGTLCTELAKLEHPALPQANVLFTIFRDWLRSRYEELGFNSQSDVLAMHLLARSQGIATLANAFDDEAFIQQEAELLHAWLGSLQTPASGIHN